MVQRTSQELNINTGGMVTAQQSGAGFAAPDPNKFATNHIEEQAPGPEDGTMSRILGHLVQAGDKLTQQAINQGREEAYLSGMAQASTAKSEADLQTNPLTRNWATAGYRDTVGRLTAADTEAQIAQDMAKMREVSPEKFGEYLSEKRKALVASWEGMSLQTREAMFAQQAMNERAWIKKHAVEHYKFGVEAETRSVKTSLDTSLASLTAAKSDAATYATATDATLTTAYQSIVANPKLPTAVKGKMVAEFATYALENDHQALYSKIHTQALPMADGKEAPMSSLLSWEDDIALSKAFRASEQRTEAFRAADWMDRGAAMRASWDNPLEPFMPLEQVRAHLAEGVQRKLVSADQYGAFMQDYYKSMQKKVTQGNSAQAWAAGDQNTLLSLGKTSDEGLNDYVATIGRKLPLPNLVDNLLNIGTQTGQDNAFKKVGELMGPAFAQIGNNDKIDPANAVAISGVLGKLEAAETAGRSGAFHQFLSAFDPEVQAKITYMREGLKKGNDATTAISAATARVLEEAQMTPAMRAELAATKSKEVLKTVDDITPTGIWGTIGLYAKSVLSPTQQGRATAAAELALRTKQGWFENDNRVAEVMATTKLEVAKSMDRITKANPHMNVGSVKSMALAEIAGRSVPTSWGPLIVPQGFSPQRYFGVAQDVGAERIGAALDEFIKPQAGGRMAFSLGVNGELMVQELNDNGKPAAPGYTLDPKQVKPMVEQQRKRIIDEFRLNHGEGVKAQLPNGSYFTYNGDNTANVDNGWMRRYRDDFTSSGAIAVSGTNVSQEQFSRGFMKDTNDAAKDAVKIMAITGTNNEPAFKLFASIANQADLKDKAYDRLVKAVRSRNLEAAQKALELTPMYRVIAGNRKQYLMTNLVAAMKE